MAQENADRIRQQREQIRQQTNLRSIFGSSDQYELATKYRTLTSQRTSLLDERDNGRDVTQELGQIGQALRVINAQMDLVNNKQIDFKLGGPLRELQEAVSLQRQFARDRDQLSLTHQQERIDLAASQATRRFAIDDRLKLDPSFADNGYALAIARDSRLAENEDIDLRLRQASESRISDASSYSTMRGSSYLDLEQRRRVLSAPNTLQTAEVKQALKDINDEIRTINQNELNIRVGGDAKTRLREIDQDLKNVTGEYSRIQLEREKEGIKRANAQQRRIVQIQRDFSGGKIDEDEYNRRIRTSERKYDYNEQFIKLNQRQEDYDNGFIDKESGRVLGNQRSVYGNNSIDRRLHYQVSQAAFGVDDAIQSYQYDGIRGAIRGASNNMTALLSTMNFSPMTMAATVIGTSLGSILIPKLFDTGEAAKTADERVKELTRDLGRLQQAASANFDFNIESSSTATSARQSRRKAEIEARKIQETELKQIQQELNSLGDLGPVGEVSWQNPFLRAASSLGLMGFNLLSGEKLTEEQWYDRRAREETEKGNTESAAWFKEQREEEIRARRRKEAEPLEEQRAKANERARVQAELAVKEDQKESILQRRETERHIQESESSYRVGLVTSTPLTPEETRKSMESLYQSAAEQFAENVRSARAELEAVGGDLVIFDYQTEDEYRQFVQQWNDQIRQKIQAARTSLDRLNEAADESDVSSLSAEFNRRASSNFDFFFGHSTDSTQIDNEARANIAFRRAEYEREQQGLRDQAIASGTAPEVANEWYRQRMRKFDLEAQKWVNDRLDHVEDLLRQENPILSDDLRSWLGKRKNAEFLAQTGIQDLSDPNLRMHQQEQEYWQQVQRDQDSLKSQRSSLRSFLDPKRALEENLKEAFEKIDDMQIDLFDKVLLKEATATKASEEYMNQNRVTNTNTAYEMGSQRVSELMQQNFNANERVPNLLESQITQLRLIHQAIERQRNLKPVKVYKMI
jgi:hypothetical protein